MNTQPIAETMDSAIQRLENLKSKTMAHPVKGVNTDINGNPILPEGIESLYDNNESTVIKTDNTQALYNALERIKELEQKLNDTGAGFSFYETEMKTLNQDYAKLEAKHKSLEQGVKDAIAVIERKATMADTIGARDNDNDFIYTATGLRVAIKVLKEKTGL